MVACFTFLPKNQQHEKYIDHYQAGKPIKACLMHIHGCRKGDLGSVVTVPTLK